MRPSGVWLLVAATLFAELLARLPLNFRTPGLLLHPLLLFVAYRHGFRDALTGALLVAAYLVYFIWHFNPPVDAESDRMWRFALLGLSVVSAAAVGFLRDRIAQLQARDGDEEPSAQTSHQYTQEILEGIADGFLLLDRDGRLTYVNRAAQALLRRTPEELLHRDVREIFPPAVYHDFYRKYQQGATPGSSIRFEASASEDTWIEVHAITSGEGVALTFRDVTERRKHEEKLRGMTLIDELTGLYNRRGFFALAEQQWKLAERKGRKLLLVFADLDNLKYINDTFGHTVGDQALFEAAAILRHTFRGTDVVARIGGDEFAALVLESDPDAAPLVLHRLEANIQQANAEGTLPFDLSLSFGMANFDPELPRPIDELLSLADHRMYEHKRAKRKG